MIPFSEITKLADEVRKKTNQYVQISIEYDAHRSGNTELAYLLFLGDNSGVCKYGTAQALIEVLKALAGGADIGVGLEEAA